MRKIPENAENYKFLSKKMKNILVKIGPEYLFLIFKGLKTAFIIVNYHISSFNRNLIMW